MEQAEPPHRIGFGGQSLVVELRNRDHLVEVSSRVPDNDRAGGESLNKVLDRALDSSFLQLRNLDSDGDTIFSRLQMRDVIPELDRLRDFARSDVEKRTIEKILGLAKRCQAQSDSYLVFLGD